MIDDDVQDGVLVGRSWADAPGIDASVYVSGENIRPGQIVPVEIVGREDYDLVGEPFGDSDRR